jgi:hypothetical protein
MARPVAMRVVVTLAGAAAVSIAAVSIARAGTLRYDFHHFYNDARYLIETGELNTADELAAGRGGPHLPWYLPFATIAFVPFATANPWYGAVLWCLLNLVSLLAIIWLVGTRLIDFRPRDWAFTQIVPICLCGAAVYEHARFNQLGVIVLLLLILAFVLLRQGRDVGAGVALALACLLKLVPGVFLVWLALKRRWTALVSAVVAAIVIGMLPCLVLFGPSRTLEYHKRWVRNSVYRGSALRMMLRADDPLYAERYGTFLDHRNQSLAMVIGRISGLVPGLGTQPERSTVRAASAVSVYLLVNAMVFASLVWFSRVSWRRLPPTGQSSEFALWLLAMLWLSPLMRQYYLIWVYPALAVLLARADEQQLAGRSSWACWIAVTCWLIGMFAWAADQWFLDHAARQLGVNLWSVLVIGVVLVLQLREIIRCDRYVRPVTGGREAATGSS